MEKKKPQDMHKPPMFDEKNVRKFVDSEGLNYYNYLSKKYMESVVDGAKKELNSAIDKVNDNTKENAELIDKVSEQCAFLAGDIRDNAGEISSIDKRVSKNEDHIKVIDKNIENLKASDVGLNARIDGIMDDVETKLDAIDESHRNEILRLKNTVEANLDNHKLDKTLTDEAIRSLTERLKENEKKDYLLTGRFEGLLERVNDANLDSTIHRGDAISLLKNDAKYVTESQMENKDFATRSEIPTDFYSKADIDTKLDDLVAAFTFDKNPNYIVELLSSYQKKADAEEQHEELKSYVDSSVESESDRAKEVESELDEKINDLSEKKLDTIEITGVPASYLEPTNYKKIVVDSENNSLSVNNLNFLVNGSSPVVGGKEVKMFYNPLVGGRTINFTTDSTMVIDPSVEPVINDDGETTRNVPTITIRASKSLLDRIDEAKEQTELRREIEGKLAEKVDVVDFEEYKSIIDSRVSTIFNFKGVVSSVEELQAVENPQVGDVWSVNVGGKDGNNFIWTNGGRWESLGTTAETDLSEYSKTEEIAEAITAATRDKLSKITITGNPNGATVIDVNNPTFAINNLNFLVNDKDPEVNGVSAKVSYNPLLSGKAINVFNLDGYTEVVSSLRKCDGHSSLVPSIGIGLSEKAEEILGNVSVIDERVTAVESDVDTLEEKVGALENVRHFNGFGITGVPTKESVSLFNQGKGDLVYETINIDKDNNTFAINNLNFYVEGQKVSIYNPALSGKGLNIFKTGELVDVTATARNGIPSIGIGLSSSTEELIKKIPTIEEGLTSVESELTDKISVAEDTLNSRIDSVESKIPTIDHSDYYTIEEIDGKVNPLVESVGKIEEDISKIESTLADKIDSTDAQALVDSEKDRAYKVEEELRARIVSLESALARLSAKLDKIDALNETLMRYRGETSYDSLEDLYTLTDVKVGDVFSVKNGDSDETYEFVCKKLNIVNIDGKEVSMANKKDCWERIGVEDTYGDTTESMQTSEIDELFKQTNNSIETFN